MRSHINFPEGASFAFTILDDTDDTTVENGIPVYDLLNDLGFKITKTVWAFDARPEDRGPYFAGSTLSNDSYFDWVKELQNSGFEIAFHNATMASSIRSDTIKALDLIEQSLGCKVRLHCNHGQNKENLHWGAERYRHPLIRTFVKLLFNVGNYPKFEGNNVNSPYYWADVADQRLSFIRGLTYGTLDCSKIKPYGPYFERAKQKSSCFFNTADAPNIYAYNRLVNRNSIDKLKKEGGWAVVSTHLGKGFFRYGKLNKDFVDTMEYISKLGGWYVPVSELLDYISVKNGAKQINNAVRFSMEINHVIDRVKNKIKPSTLK